MAGLANKDREFWEGLKNWDVGGNVDGYKRVEKDKRKVAKRI